MTNTAITCFDITNILPVRLRCIFPFLLIGSSDFLLEGDVLIPHTRNAMRCFSEAYTCLWRKSANGNVEIPFLLSEKYGRFYFLMYYINGTGYCTSTPLSHTELMIRLMKHFYSHLQTTLRGKRF